jgi:hypothetical protein
MPSIFRKSAKGATEIETRAHRLVPRLRAMLILVDGKRSDEELARLMPQHAADTLAALLAQGFVEVDVPARRCCGVPSPLGASSAPTQTASFDTTRRVVVRALNDAIGPAAETLALRMERTHNLDELRALLPLAVQAVGNMRGRSAAEAFAARFAAL